MSANIDLDTGVGIDLGVDLTLEVEAREQASQNDSRISQRALAYMREHPYATAVVISSLIGGAIVGNLLPFEDLSMLRRTAGGAIAGFYFSLFPLGFRLFD